MTKSYVFIKLKCLKDINKKLQQQQPKSVVILLFISQKITQPHFNVFLQCNDAKIFGRTRFMQFLSIHFCR